MSGPSLLEVPCTATSDGRVFGARLPDGICPRGTDREVELSNGAIVCFARLDNRRDQAVLLPA